MARRGRRHRAGLGCRHALDFRSRLQAGAGGLPGASSVLSALSVSAFPTDRFFFEGFLPPKQAARRARLTELSRINATLVLFESGNRVQDTLADLAGIMGAREAAICRELTKMHEDISRGTLSKLAQGAGELETRGEFVLVVGPPPADAKVMAEAALDDLLRSQLEQGSVKDAVAQAVELSGRARREVYARALELSRNLSKNIDTDLRAKGGHGED